MSRIFISYRRDDSADASGRIYDRLEAKYGRDNIFKDVDAILLGVDFRRALTAEVDKCDVMLVVMGQQWLRITDQQGQRRLDNPGDFVRIEVEAALARDIPVTPVLVQNAPMPQESDLPSSLGPLAYRNGIVVRSDPYFHRDMDLLIGRLELLFTVLRPTDIALRDEEFIATSTRKIPQNALLEMRKGGGEKQEEYKDQLHSARKRRGWSREQMVKALNDLIRSDDDHLPVTVDMVMRWEAGQKHPSRYWSEKLRAVYGDDRW